MFYNNPYVILTTNSTPENPQSSEVGGSTSRNPSSAGNTGGDFGQSPHGGNLQQSLLNSPFHPPGIPTAAGTYTPIRQVPIGSSRPESGSIGHTDLPHRFSRSRYSNNWRAGAGPHRIGQSAEPIQEPDMASWHRHPHQPSDPFGPLAFEGPSIGIALPTLGSDTVKTGPIIGIKEERSRPGANPNSPSFLSQFSGIDGDNYYNVVLPYVSSCNFVLESMADINFLTAMLKSPNFPDAFQTITKLSLSKLYWFSGIQHNRNTNPALAFATFLPNLSEIWITFHTAGLTASAWSERERLRLEPMEFDKSKQLKVLRLDNVIRHYDLERLLDCKNVKVIHLEVIESEMVAFYTKVGDPLSPLRDLIHWLERGFNNRHGKHVHIEAHII